MNKQFRLVFAGMLAALFACSSASASVMFVTPAFTSAAPSESVAFEIWVNFEETIIGGAFNIWFDPEVLTFVSWQHADIGDPGFQRDPDLYDGLLSRIAFGDFTIGITGLQQVGTVSFLVATTAPAGPSFVEANQAYCFQCEFVDFNTFQIVIPEYVGAQITVVPLPAGIGLLASALAMLGAAGAWRSLGAAAASAFHAVR